MHLLYQEIPWLLLLFMPMDMMPATMAVIKPGKYANQDKNEDQQGEDRHRQLESAGHCRQDDERQQDPNESIQHSIKHREFAPEF